MRPTLYGTSTGSPGLTGRLTPVRIHVKNNLDSGIHGSIVQDGERPLDIPKNNNEHTQPENRMGLHGLPR